MKLKTSAIAMAVAGIVAAPMAVQADSGFYGSVRIGLQYMDTAGDDDTTVRSYGARFGFKGETDMGNGLSGFGKYEFEYKAQGEQTGNNPINRRHAMVGVKGDFGKIYLGQTYHTYYNFVAGPIDNPWWGAGYTWLGYPGRTDETISYEGDFGAFSLGGGLLMSSDSKDSAGKNEVIDGYELAVAFDAGPMRIGIGTRLVENDETLKPSAEAVYGITLSGWETGIFTWGLSLESQDVEGAGGGTKTGIVLDVLIGNGYIHYEGIDMDTTGVGDPNTITLGYTQSLGRSTTLWYEYQTTDMDTGDSNDDIDWARAVLKYDWK